MNVYTSLPYSVENSEVFRMVYEEIAFGSSTGFGVVVCDPRRLVAAVARWPRLGDPVLCSQRLQATVMNYSAALPLKYPSVANCSIS